MKNKILNIFYFILFGLGIFLFTCDNNPFVAGIGIAIIFYLFPKLNPDVKNKNDEKV